MSVRSAEPRDEQRHGILDGRLFASHRNRDAILLAFLFICVLIGFARGWQPLGDWRYFVPAGEQLLTDRWRYVYIDNPDAQSGPLMLVMVHVLDTMGLAWARIAIMSCGLMALTLLVLDTRGHRNVRWRLALGGFFLALWWPRISAFGHIDDAVVSVLGVCSVILARRDRRMAVGLLAGLAIAVKPTAVFMLAFTVPRREWRRLTNWLPAALGVAVAGLIWSPFVLASSRTLEAMRPRMPFIDDSVPGFFGFDATWPSPTYRTAQLILVVAVPAYVAWRHGAAAVMLAGVTIRLITDPAAWQYYTPGMVLAALVWEAYSSEDRIPWLTIGSALALVPRWAVHAPNVRAGMRFFWCLIVLGVVLRGVPPVRRRWRSDASGGEVAGEVAGHPVPGA